MSDDDPVTESAKAAQEISKATGKGIDALRDVGNFAGRYVRGSAEVISAMVQRELQYVFWKRGVRLVEKAEEFAKEHGIEMTPDRIPLNLAVDILREGSMEEDDDLQDRYACLLVNAANEDAAIQVRRLHADILSQLGPLEIQILDLLHSVRDDIDTRGWVAGYALPDEVLTNEKLRSRKDGSHAQIPDALTSIAINNLVRLGCLFSNAMGGGQHQTNWVSITELGINFVEACTVKRSDQ